MKQTWKSEFKKIANTCDVSAGKISLCNDNIHYKIYSWNYCKDSGPKNQAISCKSLKPCNLIARCVLINCILFFKLWKVKHLKTIVNKLNCLKVSVLLASQWSQLVTYLHFRGTWSLQKYPRQMRNDRLTPRNVWVLPTTSWTGLQSGLWLFLQIHCGHSRWNCWFCKFSLLFGMNIPFCKISGKE